MPRGTRKATAEIGARSRKLDPQLRQARRKFDKFGKGARRDLKRSFGGIRADFGRLTALIGAGLFVQAGRSALSFEDRLNQVGVQANATNRQIDQMRDTVNRISRATGIAREEVLAGADEFVNLAGSVGFSEEVLLAFSRTARASGSQTRDLANVALVLNKNFGLSNDKLEEAFSIMLAIGKESSVPLKQLGPQLRTVAGLFEEFGVSGEKGIAQLTAAMQVLAPQFKGPEEAAAGLGQVMVQLAKKAQKLRKFGVEVFEVDAQGVKRFKDLPTIIDDISKSKLGGDFEKMVEVLGRAQTARGVKALQKGREEWQRLIDIGEKGTKTVADDFARRMQASSVKVQKSMNDLKLNIARAFTPARIQRFAEIMSKVAKAIEVMVDNLPLIATTLAAMKISRGLGALIDFAAAGGLAAATTGAPAAVSVGRIKATSILTGAVVSAKAIEYLIDEAGDAKISRADRRARGAVYRERAEAGTDPFFVAAKARQFGVLKDNGRVDLKAAALEAGGIRSEYEVPTSERRGLFGKGLQLAFQSILAQKKADRIRLEITVDQQGQIMTRQKEERDARRSK